MGATRGRRPHGVRRLATRGRRSVPAAGDVAVRGAPPAVDASAALGYLWLGLPGGLLAYILWFRGIATLPVTSVAVLTLLSPMVAALLGAVLLDELLTPVQAAGFVLCLAAIVAGQVSPTRAKATTTLTKERINK
ncbi:hypothetical protein GCM10029963_08010 [Micromonospora andamanensis]